MLTGTPRVTKLRIEAQTRAPRKATALLIPALGNRNGNRTKVACAHPARPVPHHVKRAVGEDLEPQPTVPQLQQECPEGPPRPAARDQPPPTLPLEGVLPDRSEEHTSELQSLRHLVCRLLLEKKKKNKKINNKTKRINKIRT